jgi:hypothetical protein
MKTAVEWLFEQFVKKSCITLKDIQIAKAMEKEQIIESFSLGIISHHDAFKNQNKWDNGEQYYNKTFKSE